MCYINYWYIVVDYTATILINGPKVAKFLITVFFLHTITLGPLNHSSNVIPKPHSMNESHVQSIPYKGFGDVVVTAIIGG